MKNFYVVKSATYTTICNIALRDKTLSLKAKGLYAFITSLPKDWDYTVNGLVAVLKEGRDAIMTALQELEEHGYLKRYRVRAKDGRLEGACYLLLEKPCDVEETTKVGKSYIGKQETKEEPSVLTKEKEKNIYKKRRKNETHHFANERNYTKEELDALIDDLDSIVF